jgi:GNAT superfamily N-acetyltransferase
MESGDSAAVVELLRLSLGDGGSPTTLDFWRWKHRDNPFGQSPVLVAEAEGTLVGVRAFLRWPLEGADGSVAAVRAVDTATHPEWQRCGVFTRLTQALLEQITEGGDRLVFNTPNRQSGAGYLEMGWKTLGKVRLRAYLPRPLAALAAPAHSEGAWEPKLDLEPVSALLEWPGLESVLAAHDSAADDRLHTPLSEHYLDWRYVRVPELRYGCLFDSRRGARVALVLRGRSRGTLRELRLTEVLTDGEPAKVSRLVREMVRELCSASGADYVVADAAAPVPGLALRAGPTFMVRPLGEPTRPDPTARESWRLSIGDLEVF